METAQNWQRRTGILRERMPGIETKSFVFSVTLLMISTSCTFRFPSRVGLDVVKTELPPCKPFASLRVVWGERGIIFYWPHRNTNRLLLLPWSYFCSASTSGSVFSTKLVVSPLHGWTPNPSSALEEIPAVPWFCRQMQHPFHVQQQFLPSCSLGHKNEWFWLIQCGQIWQRHER